MREKDECGPNIGLVRLLIYLCQADFNTGATDLSRLSPSSPNAGGVNTEHLNRKQLYLCACITTRGEIPTTFIMFREAEHEKRRKLFIGKTQIALLLLAPRRVELRGSDNFVQLRLSTCYWIYFISLNPGSKYRGKERGPAKVHFNILMVIINAAGQRLYYQGFYESLYKHVKHYQK